MIAKGVDGLLHPRTVIIRLPTHKIGRKRIQTVTTSPTVLRLPSRLEQVGFSDIVKLRNRVMALRKEGATVYQFEGGEPFMPTPDSIKEAMKRALDENQTRYAPSSGIPELREAIAETLRTRNRIPAQSENVIVVNG